MLIKENKGIMEFDRDLLASIASGGLGHWVDLEDGSQKYMKDQDCIGKYILLAFFRSFIILTLDDRK